MSAKSILEADGKAILNYHLTRAPVIKPTPLPAQATHNPPPKLASLYFPADEDVKGVLDQAEATYPWLLTPGSKFVAKPDQLIKRRGKSGLLALNKTWPEAREWIEARAGKEQRVETVDGVLRQFLVEPFVPHPQDTEYYININSVREVRSPCFNFFFVSFLHFFASSRFKSVCARTLPGTVTGVEKTCLGVLGVSCARACGAGGLAQAHGRTAWFCLKAGRTKGTLADPLLQSTYSFAMRTSTFTCQFSWRFKRLTSMYRVLSFQALGVAALASCICVGHCAILPILSILARSSR